MNARMPAIVAIALVTWNLAAQAQAPSEPPPAPSPADASYAKRVEPRFLNFAGSSENLSSIATGMRHGTQFTITDGAESAVIDPPTKPMGYGNITRALDLANRDLAAQGITDPTPSQTAGALNDVLTLRSQGMGWGQIAHALNLHPGLGSTRTAVQAPTSSTTTLKSSGGTSSRASSSGITTALGTSVAQPGARGVGRQSAGSPGSASSTGGTVTAAGIAGSAGGTVTAAGARGSGNGAVRGNNGNGNGYGRGGKN